MIRIGNKCIDSTTIVLIVGIMIMSTIAIASIMQTESMDPNDTSMDATPPDSVVWIPTKEDIQYQDSMWTIINETQNDVEIIKEDIEVILYKLDRIEIKDGKVKLHVQ